MSSSFRLLLAAGCLAGCTSVAPPVRPEADPSRADAAEGIAAPRKSSLRADEATRKTRELLTAAGKEQDYWDEHGPVSGTPEEAPKANTTPEKKHDH